MTRQMVQKYEREAPFFYENCFTEGDLLSQQVNEFLSHLLTKKETAAGSDGSIAVPKRRDSDASESGGDAVASSLLEMEKELEEERKKLTVNMKDTSSKLERLEKMHAQNVGLASSELVRYAKIAGLEAEIKARKDFSLFSKHTDNRFSRAGCRKSKRWWKEMNSGKPLHLTFIKICILFQVSFAHRTVEKTSGEKKCSRLTISRCISFTSTRLYLSFAQRATRKSKTYSCR